MKVFVNIILILLISFSLYVMPLNLDLFNLDADNILGGDDKLEELSPEDRLMKADFVFTAPQKDTLKYSPEFYTLRIDSTEDFKDGFEDYLKIDLKFIDKNAKIKTFDESNLKYKTEISGKTMTLSLPISPSDLGLRYSNYRISIKCGIGKSEHVDELNVFYEKSNINLQENEGKNADASLIPIFYSDIRSEYQVPVFRQYISKSNVFANVFYSAEEKTSTFSSVGLKPWNIDLSFRPRVWYSNGSLEIKLANSNIKAIRDQKDAKSVFENIASSFGISNLGYVINELDYILIEQAKQEVFGVSLDSPFKVDKSPAVYLPMFYSADSYYWVPFKFELSENVGGDVKNIVNAYMGMGRYMDDDRFISLIPDLKFLESVTLMGGVLRLELSPESKTFFESNTTYLNMLIEGLSLSVSSIENIDALELWLNGKPLDVIGGVNLGKQILPPKAFNIVK